MTTLLLVEDDMDLAGNILDYLALDNFVCDHASNGVAALNLLQNNAYAVIILDINLPRQNGLSVCQTLRQRGDVTPIIMLTARDQLDDKLTGFAAGADDYLVKPFAMAELSARLQALAGRRSNQAQKLGYAGLILHRQTRQVQYQQQVIKLSPTATKVLETLLEQAPEPVSRFTLVQAVWGDNAPDSNSLKVHIHALRKALSGSTPLGVEAVSGVGFRLTGAPL
ncbi:response regulator transcription factor [Salinimonas lutimaris]|uniref:response regulator transcription factor n=1 Tax=Salinimonas lutimaris TaxID=914153 RepID=UPI0010C007D7|nr:response regulator transcription factor [Salinimonas lutimaris]